MLQNIDYRLHCPLFTCKYRSKPMSASSSTCPDSRQDPADLLDTPTKPHCCPCVTKTQASWPLAAAATSHQYSTLAPRRDRYAASTLKVAHRGSLHLCSTTISPAETLPQETVTLRRLRPQTDQRWPLSLRYFARHRSHR